MMLNNLINFAATCKPKSFFGLEPWYKYINDPEHFGNKKDSCDITSFKVLGSSSDIPLVLLAVVDSLLRIAAFFAVGFVIVGGIQLITSQGDPESTGKAQSTIINALIGLAVAVVAVAFVAFLGNRLGST